jgi:hypothetical protein
MRVLGSLLFFHIFFVSMGLHAAIKTAVVGEGFSLISGDYDLSPKTFELVGVHLHSDRNPTDFFKIDLSARYAVGSPVLSYVNVRELYVNFAVGEISNLYVGRRLMNWSAIDNIWNLGVIQPQFKWNQLSPQNQGLLGFFWESSFWGVDYTLFATPIYIPDQGAGYEIKDGQFQSGNPFFHAPPQNVKFGSQVLPIDYDIHRPEVNDVISQTMYGAQLRVGDERGFFGRIAGIYKPSNQLALGFKGVLVTTRVRVDVLPKTYYETDYSLDAGYKADWGYAQMTVLATNPHSPEFDPVYNHPIFESGVSYGPQFLYRLNPFQFLLAYINTSGAQVKDEGPDVTASMTSLSERFLIKQATLLKVAYSEVYKKFVRWDSSFQFKYSDKEKFREIRVKNALSFKNPWSVWVDVILVDTDSAVQSNYESYKNFDQAWLGVSYDF